MSVSLIGWGRFTNAPGQRITVPAPSTDRGKPWLWGMLTAVAANLASVGFDRIQLPPASKAQGGDGAGCDGYGVYDPRDLGTKNQQGSTPTRYGTAESLRRLVATAHQYGLAVDLDLVLHQLIGGNNATYTYLGADGKTLNGRGAMHPGCFRKTATGKGTQPEDAVPVPSDDFAFGDEKVYQHCNPANYTINDALDYGDWLFRTTGADGARIDDTKGLWASFASQFMHHGAMANKPFYSEYFDGNPANLNWWATSPPMSSRSGVEDFNIHFAIQTACNNLYARALDGAGYSQWNPGLAYGFVDNPDTDTSPGEQVITSKLLGYAYLLTISCKQVLVYGKDYFSDAVWPGAYGLKPLIDNLIYINRTFAYGNQTTRWVDNSVIVIERDGNGGEVGTSPGLLTALNFDTYNRRQITCATSFGANTQLHDYTGRHEDIWTDWQGNATFTIPSNAYGGGQSYLCFSHANADKPITHQPRRTTQVFFGAPDLDIPPATFGGWQSIARIYVQKNTLVTFSKQANLQATLLDQSTPVPGSRPTKTGWYGIGITTSSSTPVNFTLSVTYTGGTT
jgi:alpha-amylase